MPSPYPVREQSPKTMDNQARLDLASSGALIREIESRGYRVFLAHRVKNRKHGWYVAKEDDT